MAFGLVSRPRHKWFRRFVNISVHLSRHLERLGIEIDVSLPGETLFMGQEFRLFPREQVGKGVTSYLTFTQLGVFAYIIKISNWDVDSYESNNYNLTIGISFRIWIPWVRHSIPIKWDIPIAVYTSKSLKDQVIILQKSPLYRLLHYPYILNKCTIPGITWIQLNFYAVSQACLIKISKTGTSQFLKRSTSRGSDPHLREGCKNPEGRWRAFHDRCL